MLQSSRSETFDTNNIKHEIRICNDISEAALIMNFLSDLYYNNFTVIVYIGIYYLLQMCARIYLSRNSSVMLLIGTLDVILPLCAF